MPDKSYLKDELCRMHWDIIYANFKVGMVPTRIAIVANIRNMLTAPDWLPFNDPLFGNVRIIGF